MVAPAGTIYYGAIMALQMCEFKVYGKPIGKGRPRFSKNGHTYTPSKTREYEKRIASAAWAEMKHRKLSPTDRRVNLIVASYFDIPKSYSKQKRIECQEGIIIPSRPDVDNIGKAVADACNKICYKDDAQIWFFAMSKQYCDEEQVAHIHVKVQWDDPNKNSQPRTILAI